MLACLHLSRRTHGQHILEADSSSSCAHKDLNGVAGTQHNSGEALTSYVYAYICVCWDEGATRMQQLLNVQAYLGTQHTHFIVTQGDRKPLDKTLHACPFTCATEPNKYLGTQHTCALMLHAPNDSTATSTNACMQHSSFVYNALIYTYHY